jgi:phospholipid/cholesterol/gamma-HCH transport system permease protein
MRRLSGTKAGVTGEVITRTVREGGTTLLAGTGKTVNRQALVAGRALLLFVDAMKSVGEVGRTTRQLMRQVEHAGFGSLFVLGLIAGLTGMIMAVQIGYALQDYGEAATSQLGGIIAITFCRELGPIWAAVIVLARVGASMAAELGTMTVNEEVDALRVMSISPVRYLVMPRIVGLIMVMPLLALVANAVGILGGLVVGQSQFHQTSATYFQGARDFLTATDVISGLVKASVFGAIIGTIACDRGLNTSDGAEGVGKATTDSVVLNVIFVLLADLIMTWFVQVPMRTWLNA